jgi:hypothetical protein
MIPNPEGGVLSLSKQAAFSAETCHPFGIIIPGDARRYNHDIPSGFSLRYVLTLPEKKRRR